MDYGELMKSARKRKGISQRELGKITGASQSLISAWEKNQRRISLVEADKIFSLLGVSVTIGKEVQE